MSLAGYVVGWAFLFLGGAWEEPPGAGPAGVTEAERLDLARRIETAFAAGDLETIERVFDKGALFTRATRDIGWEPDFLAGARSGFLRGGWGKRIHAELGAEGSYRFLRLREEGALFRVLLATGVNYHQLHLERSAAGELRVVDFYAYSTGELMSETVRRLLVNAVPREKPGFLEKLFGRERSMARHLQKLTDLERCRAEERWEEGLAIYRRLPREVQLDKVFLMARLMLALHVESDEYLQAIEDFERAFPGDPALDLVSIDGHFLRKRHDQALATIDRLDRKLGGDPYLDDLRASLHLDRGALAPAKELARRALTREPGLLPAHWTLVTIALKEKDHRETARLLTVIEKDFEVELADLESVEEYRDFVKSPEYRRWRAARAAGAARAGIDEHRSDAAEEEGPALPGASPGGG